MDATELTRRRFLEGSAVVGGGLALAGPLSALRAASAHGRVSRAPAYGPLRATPEIDTGVEWLELPKGFRYRVISKQGEMMRDGNPTPGIFDGMAAFRGRGGRTILIRNHENRSFPGEIPVEVPAGNRYDGDANVRGGNTKLVVRDRELVRSFAVLGGTHTNCAGGRTPWRTWVTCEEIFSYGPFGTLAEQGVPHGYAFEVPAGATGPVEPLPIKAAGRFAHEAVAWLEGSLYETEDRSDAAFYRFVPRRQPREYGDLAASGGALYALAVKGEPNFDADLATAGESYRVEWVTIDDPDPETDTVRAQAQAKGAAIFDRCEGCWSSDGRVYFDCTTGGESGLGQVWELTPRGRRGGDLRLVYESASPEDLTNPDNLVVVPATGHVFLQEDTNEPYVRGINRGGEIYDFAKAVRNPSEFCGGCFDPNGKTFYLNQQGARQIGSDPLNPPDETAAVTYAIWGPFGG